MTRLRDGLSSDDIVLAKRSLRKFGRVEIGTAETGAQYVEALDRDGFPVRTICREAGRFAVLDETGRPLKRGRNLWLILSAMPA